MCPATKLGISSEMDSYALFLQMKALHSVGFPVRSVDRQKIKMSPRWRTGMILFKEDRSWK